MTIEEAVAESAESLTVYIVKETLFCNVYEESARGFIEIINAAVWFDKCSCYSIPGGL